MSRTRICAATPPMTARMARKQQRHRVRVVIQLSCHVALGHRFKESLLQWHPPIVVRRSGRLQTSQALAVFHFDNSKFHSWYPRCFCDAFHGRIVRRRFLDWVWDHAFQSRGRTYVFFLFAVCFLWVASGIRALQRLFAFLLFPSLWCWCVGRFLLVGLL